MYDIISVFEKYQFVTRRTHLSSWDAASLLGLRVIARAIRLRKVRADQSITEVTAIFLSVFGLTRRMTYIKSDDAFWENPLQIAPAEMSGRPFITAASACRPAGPRVSGDKIS